MAYRNLSYNIFAALFIMTLCIMPVAAAEDIANVPSWIREEIGVKTPAEGGYFVNEESPEGLEGFF